MNFYITPLILLQLLLLIHAVTIKRDHTNHTPNSYFRTVNETKLKLNNETAKEILEIQEILKSNSKKLNEKSPLDFDELFGHLLELADEHDSSIGGNDSGNDGRQGNHSNHEVDDHDQAEHHGVHVATWRFEYVQEPFILTCFVMAIAVVKILFHHCKRLAEIFPESCLLIIMGLGLGCLFIADTNDEYYSFLAFDGHTFFLFLLPPIILEAAYSLKDRSFIENIGTILLYAVVGTVLNAAFIGISLFGLSQIGAMGGFQIGLAQCLIFSSLIAAVDPVAVLAIFQEVGVNKVLYYMVFGESLLNDAVTVVLYNLMVSFDKIPHITAKDIALGFAAFISVSIGGLCIGVICGFITAYVTKFTTKIRVVEPVMLFGMAYASYLLAEMVHFSGIISIIGCGLIQAQYAVENISSKSYITVHYFSKVASSVTESLIFIILGVMLINKHQYWHDWQTAFSIFALILCIGARFASVFGLTYFVNCYMFGTRVISYKEQFIMAYGGLRGAMSFSLVFLLDDSIETKNTMMCASYLIIMFTVFAQGMTIKPLVHYLHITLQQTNVEEQKVFKEVNRGVIDNASAAIEEIIGHHGASYWTALAKYFSQHFIRPAIQKVPTRKASSILAAAEDSSMMELMHRSNSVSSMSSSSKGSLMGELKHMDDEGISGAIGEHMLDLQDRMRTDSDHHLKRNESGSSFDNFDTPVSRKTTSLAPEEFMNLKKLMIPIGDRLSVNTFDRNLTSEHSHGHSLRNHLHHMNKIRKSLRQHKRNKSVAKHMSVEEEEGETRTVVEEKPVDNRKTESDVKKANGEQRRVLFQLD